MESIAIMAAVALCKVIGYGIVGSFAVESELAKIRDTEKLEKIKGFYYDSINDSIDMTTEMADRAQTMQRAGMGVFDSYHTVCAEEAGADFLLTTDDDFIKAALRLNLSVKVINPLNFSIGGNI
jgi:predicted nucleic acid-binding protein